MVLMGVFHLVWSHYNKQQMSSTPNGNVSKCQLKVKEHGTNGTHIVATSRGENDCDHASGNMISGMKRKSSNDNMPETSFQFGQKSWDLTGKYGQLQNTYQSKHSPEGLEKFKEVIGEEIRSDLQSCGWVDKVDAFMSIRKKFCRLTMDKLPGDTELRKLLISDARNAFYSSDSRVTKREPHWTSSKFFHKGNLYSKEEG
ncbi:hypothetical protein J5N97_010605 [Dioscorea zingiberensis]|uniref:Uncharacterized protein n=1 Tax=Dioscorea zingiberensis TaxID=325984 RepID=A0A9D5HMJ7_9LILI|nr:hypothetical protein J5N97_010605 [Dioscorea zingiberensis]